MAQAQAITVQLMTDEPTPHVLNADYQMGQTNIYTFVYGPRFLVKVSYGGADNLSLSLVVSGGQPDYDLVWQADGDGAPRTFDVQLGPSATGLSGTASDLYYRNDGTLQAFSGQATRYQIGVRATRNASVDLETDVVLTVTLN
ncbi:hypothetical protein GCM10008938_13080 [Deinococcus roseus]|uniref:Uncharacterized protein n=1 Tax=Deinococcus roseus TaxID=392414 RepID=A0ABQ2CWQ9_9DEIO|nr:hypothetical protein GCM10008938_13080 [Deinococcus roseus]